jgi:hypothetical protein
VSGRKITESDFRARAGLLTIMFLASVLELDLLRRMLEEANSAGGLSEDATWVAEVNAVAEREREAEAIGHEDEEAIEEPAGEAIAGDLRDRPVAFSELPMGTTAQGAESVVLGFALERWLAMGPEGECRLGTPAASHALLALVFGCSSTVVHRLAEQPLTVPELARRIEGLGPTAIAEHTEFLVRGRLVEERHDDDGQIRYAATDWLRHAVFPLTLAARMEHRHPRAERAPIDALDFEAALLLALPLLARTAQLSPSLSGSCSFSAQLGRDREGPLAGVTVEVEAGRLVSCAAGVSESADDMATAPIEGWLDIVAQPEARCVQIDGEGRLATALLGGLGQALLGRPA